MKHRLLFKFLSILLNLLTSFLAAFIYFWFKDFFGVSDIAPFLVWSIPISITAAFIGSTFALLSHKKKLIIRLLVAFGIAAVMAIGYYVMVWLVLGGWINAFSLPILYLWLISLFIQLVFLQFTLKQTKNSITLVKLILNILGLPILTIGVVIIGFTVSIAIEFVNAPSPETYYIPDGYIGPIVIVHGEECGVNPPVIDGRREYYIPNNGVLIIQPEFEGGIIDHVYYYVNSDGQKRQIQTVELGGTSSYGGIMTEGIYSSESPTSINCTDIYVYKDSLNQVDFNNDSNSDLVRRLVAECRESIKE